jgi:uncharacterized protein (UPF0332 family)
MEQDTAIYLTKAIESLLTAETESINGRYNSCANRCYYACFQAAIVSLLSEGIRPAGHWNHQFVQAQFVGVLITTSASDTIVRFGGSLPTTRVFATMPTTGLNSSPPPKLRGH